MTDDTMAKIVTAAARLMPKRVVRFLYERRHLPLIRAGRNLTAKLLGDTREGLLIEKGPLKGFKFAFIDSIAMWTGGHEPDVQRKILEVVEPGWTCLEVGGHVGYHVLLLAKQVGSSGKVVTFEPDPENFEILNRNVQMNGLSSVVMTFNKGMGSARAFGELKRGDLSISTKVALGQGGSIEVTTLDHEIYENGIPKPDFVLLDAQHQEVRIMEGAKRFLTEESPTVLAQHEPFYVKEMVQFMSSLGYSGEDVDIAHKLFRRTS